MPAAAAPDLALVGRDAAVQRRGPAPRPDRSARALEAGLCLLLVAAPLPFGAVGPVGRLSLEIGAGLLLLCWLLRGLSGRATPLPPRAARLALVGLLGLVTIQALPGGPLVDLISPASAGLREQSATSGAAAAGEAAMLGRDPQFGTRTATLSVDPDASASALRTGAALAAILVVATSVCGLCGRRRLALALLLSATVQALYGVATVFSTNPRIWWLAKSHYLDSATGTLINRNHFACLLAMSAACGLGLVLHGARRLRRGEGRLRLVERIDGAAARVVLLALAVGIVCGGIAASLSRAGIATGIAAVGLAALAGSGVRGSRARLLVAWIVVALALVPLVQLGGERLADRVGRIGQDLAHSAGRPTVWSDTLRMSASFPVVGSGVGTFATIYPLYRSPAVRQFFAHAHSDPLQWAAESGALGVALLGLFAWPLGRRIWRGVAGHEGALGAGFAAALVGVGLHSLVDFNLHIPAVAATAAAIAGATLVGATRTTRQAARRVPARRTSIVVLGLTILGAGLIAGPLGAELARRPPDPRALARAAERTLLTGDTATARVALRTLRERLGRSPLDSQARVTYAALLYGLARDADGIAAAAHHARRAAALAPVTVSVQRPAALILFRAGDGSGAAAIVRSMFGYDRSTAAETLMQIRPLLRGASDDEWLPDDPAAWLAWATRLRRSGREPAARERIERAFARWPEDPDVLTVVATRALTLEQWDRLGTLLEPAAETVAAHAPLLAIRAHWRAARGESDAARADLIAAGTLDDRTTGTRRLIGGAWSELGEVELARRSWQRALFDLDRDSTRARVTLLERLGRLEQRHGHASSASRHWRALLAIEPQHVEARRSLRELGIEPP